MTIRLAETSETEDIVRIINETDLSEIYFKEKDLHKIIYNAISKHEVHILLADEILGFIWTKEDGSFDKYPFLHMIAVKSNQRSKGYGKYLLNFFEHDLYADSERFFLMVGNFNTRAKKLYETIGYQNVGVLPKFYCDRVDEFLMMKVK